MRAYNVMCTRDKAYLLLFIYDFPHPIKKKSEPVKTQKNTTATIYAEPGDSTPDVSRGSIASGAQTSFLTLACQPGNCNITVYAKAQASGETMSNTTSVYFQ